MQVRPLVVEDLAVALSARAAVPQKLSFVDLERTPLILLPRHDPIREAMDSAAMSAGIRLSVHAELGAIEDVIAAVNLTGCPALLPRFVVTRFAQAGTIGQTVFSDPRVPLCLFLMMARNRPLKRAASIACDVLLETIEDLVRTSVWPGRYVGHVDSAANLVTIFTNTDKSP